MRVTAIRPYGTNYNRTSFQGIFKKKKEAMEGEQGEQNTVKIMTVHGSKGLQSNIVFMPDAQRVPSKGETFFWADEFPIWIARKDLKNNALTSIYDEKDILREEEYHRLLYVALTRARDRLYICGYKRGNGIYNILCNSCIICIFNLQKHSYRKNSKR